MIPGTVELDLRKLVAPAKTPEKCSLDMMDNVEIGPHKAEQNKSLFAQQSVRGWWPCSIEQDGKKVLGVSMNRNFSFHLIRWNHKTFGNVELKYNIPKVP